jgi:hypothetical protein
MNACRRTGNVTKSVLTLRLKIARMDFPNYPALAP